MIQFEVQILTKKNYAFSFSMISDVNLMQKMHLKYSENQNFLNARNYSLFVLFTLLVRQICVLIFTYIIYKNIKIIHFI